MFPIDQLQGRYPWWQFTGVGILVLIPFVVLAASEGGRKLFLACLASCICVVAAPLFLFAEGFDRLKKAMYKKKILGFDDMEKSAGFHHDRMGNRTAFSNRRREKSRREASVLINSEGESIPLWDRNWCESDVSQILQPAINHHKNCPERTATRVTHPFPQPNEIGIFGRPKFTYVSTPVTLDSLSEMDSVEHYIERDEDVYSIPEDVFESASSPVKDTTPVPPALGKL